VDTIVQAIRDKHASRHAAAALAGISYVCLLDWEDRGQAGEEPYARFSDRLAQAEAEAEVDVVDRLLNSKLTDGAKFWLERRFPDRFGNRGKQTHELTGADGGPVQVEVDVPPDGELAQFLLNAAAILGGSAEGPPDEGGD